MVGCPEAEGPDCRQIRATKNVTQEQQMNIAIAEISVDELLNADTQESQVDENSTAARPATSKTGPGLENKIPLIDRPSLKGYLDKLAVEISDDDLRELTETQAEVLWDWMDNGEKLEDRAEWMGLVPDFLKIEELEEVERVVLIRPDGSESPSSDGSDAGESPAAAGPAAEITSETPVATVEELQGKLSARDQHLALITETSERANKLREALEDAASEVRSAKAHEKECREELDQAEKELSRVIADAKSGQQQLPFDGPAGDQSNSSLVTGQINGEAFNGTREEFANAVVSDAREQLGGSGTSVISHPISDLGNKAIKKLIGADEFESAKIGGCPVGLSDAQLEKFDQVDIATIEQLEKFISTDAFWHRKIKGFGESTIDRVTSTIVAFRKVKPVIADSE